LITVAISTLGCKVNQYESAGILENLDKSTFLLVPFNTKADCYIINTCTVTGRTDYQSRQLIRRATRMNPDACIIVTGCYAQVAPEELARIPGVTLVAGNAEKENIPEVIQNIVKGNQKVSVSNISSIRKFSGLSPLKFPGHTRAFLKIQDGCNCYCSYCIVPYARGQSRSLPETEVLNRIEMLTSAHYKEVVLTGIHLGVYGQDLNPPINLCKILEYVERNRTMARLRLSSLEITEISDDIIRLMQKGTTICRHLHIPLQSGNKRILAAMKRNYGPAFFENRIEEIVQAVPDIAIGIDVMVGFPGEGEEEFNSTCKLIADLPVAYLHVFPYSERPGTLSSGLPGKISETVKKRRSEILRSLGRKKRMAFAERFIGVKMAVLVEDNKDKKTGFWKGFSDNYIPMLIKSSNSSLANCIVNVIPDYIRDGKLYGRVVDNDR
jgi:threonylcarbamoyladenosine tRNA methylthiotransferase MtaB